MLKKILASYINSEHGWAVAEQFEDTYDGEDFDKQNINALDYILDSLREIDTDILSNDSRDELNEYIDRLESYLN